MSAEDFRLNLLFFSAGGVAFGCDADQAEGIGACRDPEGVRWLHRELGFGREISYREPSVLTIGGDISYRVVVDSLEQVAEVELKEIRPLPLLLEPFALRRGIWGVIPRDRRLVLLVDFQLLKRAAAKTDNAEGGPA